MVEFLGSSDVDVGIELIGHEDVGTRLDLDQRRKRRLAPIGDLDQPVRPHVSLDAGLERRFDERIDMSCGGLARTKRPEYRVREGPDLSLIHI